MFTTMENKVVRKLVKELDKAGWKAVAVFDGEETVKTNTLKAVIDNVFSVDDSQIIFRKAVVPFAPQRRVVCIVLGNGADCIADHSCSREGLPVDDFEAVIDGAVMPYIDSL